MEQTVFSKWPVPTTLVGISVVLLCMNIVGPYLGKSLFMSFDDSVESIAAGMTLGKILGFFGSAAGVWYLGSRPIGR